jgi:lipoate-protein ligase A
MDDLTPKKEWRYIDSGIADPAYTMALDEAILLSKVHGKNNGNPVPEATLHLYSRDPPAISLGYFQKVNDEVRTDLCEEWGVKILRRGSGGGAIYTDSNQIIYGLIISAERFGTIPDSFNIILNGVVETFKLFGLPAEIRGLNDIIINGKKISGCAQTRKNNVILQHGTFLLDFDLSRISQILTPSNIKLQDKRSANILDQITSLANLLGYTPSHDEVKKNIIQGFENAFDVKIVKGTLTNDEKEYVDELLIRKYHNSDWNLRR